MKIWILVAVVLLPTEAAAQSVIFRGGYAREIKRFSGEPGTSVLDTGASGVDIAVGTSVTPRCTVALEIGLTEQSSVTRTTVVSFVNQNVDIRTEYANRLTTWSALVGLRGAPAGRLQLTYLGGLTFAHLWRSITPESPRTILAPAPPPTPSITVDNVAAATVGVDAAIRVTDRLAIVFYARAHALTVSADLSGFSIRPGVAAQLAF